MLGLPSSRGCASGTLVVLSLEVTWDPSVRADLTAFSATLRRGVWAGARFERANLSHADLSHGDFRSAVFRGAILTHASFREADVDAADFRGAREHACLASPTLAPRSGPSPPPPAT